jgi:hypothetical protein
MAKSPPTLPTAPDACEKPPAWQRWANILARSVHLVAVVFLGASVLGAPLHGATAAATAAASGLLMLALDVRKRKSHLTEVAGATMLAKFALLAWMATDDAARPVLFWLVLVASAVIAHAPAHIRHIALLRRGRD